jgi:hypothetical protein
MSEEKKETVKEATELFTASAKTKNHIRKNKKKYIGGAMAISVLIAILEMWPSICPLIPLQLQCHLHGPAVELGKKGLQELEKEIE